MSGRRKPGPQARRRGLGTTDLLERAKARGADIGEQRFVELAMQPPRGRHIIATRPTLRARISRAARLAALRFWRWSHRRWVERCKVDGCMTPEELEAARRFEASLDVRIMIAEAE